MFQNVSWIGQTQGMGNAYIDAWIFALWLILTLWLKPNFRANHWKLECCNPATATGSDEKTLVQPDFSTTIFLKVLFLFPGGGFVPVDVMYCESVGDFNRFTGKLDCFTVLDIFARNAVKTCSTKARWAFQISLFLLNYTHCMVRWSPLPLLIAQCWIHMKHSG